MGDRPVNVNANQVLEVLPDVEALAQAVLESQSEILAASLVATELGRFDDERIWPATVALAHLFVAMTKLQSPPPAEVISVAVRVLGDALTGT